MGLAKSWSMTLVCIDKFTIMKTCAWVFYLYFWRQQELQWISLLRMHLVKLTPSFQTCPTQRLDAACIFRTWSMTAELMTVFFSLHMHLMQAFEAAQHAANVDQLVVAKLDLQRFKAINTVKGDWSLLKSLLLTSDATSDRQGGQNTSLSVIPENTSTTQLSLEDARKAIREIAENLLGEKLPGRSLTFPPACRVACSFFCWKALIACTRTTSESLVARLNHHDYVWLCVRLTLYKSCTDVRVKIWSQVRQHLVLIKAEMFRHLQ